MNNFVTYLLTNYYLIAAVLLYCIGFGNLLINRNMVKKVIGINISIASVYLLLASQGYISGGAPPIIVSSFVDGVADGIAANIDAALYVNPIPAGMILTGIVISFSVTAFALALIVKLYKLYGTLYLDEVMKKIAQEEEITP